MVDDFDLLTSHRNWVAVERYLFSPRGEGSSGHNLPVWDGSGDVQR